MDSRVNALAQDRCDYDLKKALSSSDPTPKAVSLSPAEKSFIDANSHTSMLLWFEYLQPYWLWEV